MGQASSKNLLGSVARMVISCDMRGIPIFKSALLTALISIVISSLAALPVNTAYAASPTRPQVSIPFQCQESAPDSLQLMVHVDSAYAYKTNAWVLPIGRLIKFQCYPVIGRDPNNEWLKFNYGSSEAWVPRSAVRMREGLDMTQVPPVKTLLATSQPVPLAAAGLSTITPRIKALYKQALKVGRDPKLVTVMGDCNSEYQVFFGRLAAGAVNLSLAPKLQKTASWFAPSFVRPSVATHGSFNVSAAFDDTWSDPKKCTPGEGPLACELRLSKASIILISLGTGDTFSWQNFDGPYRKAINYVLSNNAIPVLMTKADTLESLQAGAPVEAINNMVRALGAEYGVPVIDFGAVAKTLPNRGLMEEHNASGQVTTPFHLNDKGMDIRIVMTLQTLSAISGK